MTKENWVLKKELNLGDVLTMLCMVATILVFVGAGWLYLHNTDVKHNQRLTVVETRQAEMRREVDKYQTQMHDRFDRVEDLIHRLDDKLDQKVDRP